MSVVLLLVNWYVSSASLTVVGEMKGKGIVYEPLTDPFAANGISTAETSILCPIR
jgi:hypothetical protein